MAAESLLKFEHVRKTYGNNTVVKDMSFEIKDGEFVAILGPSGCGKTTSLRMIAGLERCDGGQVTLDGRVVDNPGRKIFVPTNKRELGMVFQSYAIWPHMNVFENVAYPLRIRKVPKAKIKEEVQKVLDIVDLGHLAERKATQLSGGQQQRVALARSLVFNPKILLLDEPFSNLDAKLREHMRIEVKLLQERLGIAVVFVTHDQVEALSLADRIIMMNEGDIQQVGSPKEIYEDPQTPFVRDFLGKSIMVESTITNVLPDGEIETLKEGTNPVKYRTHKHFFENPSVGDTCHIAVRSEDVVVVPAEEAPTHDPESNVPSFTGTIRTLLFNGYQYEVVIELDDGKELYFYLPKNYDWHEGQQIVMKFNRGVSVWPDIFQVW